MLLPSDRRTISAVVSEGMAKRMVDEGWVRTLREGGKVIVQKTFATNAQIAQQLDAFAAYRIPAAVVGWAE